MQTIKEILSARIRAAFAAAFPDADLSALNLDALPAADESFGDYQCNGAMAASKLLRRPPRATSRRSRPIRCWACRSRAPASG